MNRALLQDRKFRRLWLGNLAANTGFWMQATAAAWIITGFSKSPGLGAAIQVAATAPVFLFSLVGGAIADEGSKPRILFFLQVMRSFFAFVLALVCVFPGFGSGQLLFLTFALGTVNALTMPTWQSAVSILVPKESLAGAASLNNFSFNFGRAVGSTLAGILLGLVAGHWGATLVFGLNALSSIFLIRTYRAWMKTESSVETVDLGKAFSKLPAGIMEVVSTPGFIAVIGFSAIVFALATGVWALLPVFSHEIKASSGGFGMLMGCIGVGSLIAAILLPRLKGIANRTDLRMLSIGIFALSEALLAKSTTLEGAVFPAIGIGTGWALLVSITNAEVQQLFEPGLRARAIAIYLMFFYAAMSVGSYLWGQAAERIGVARCFQTAALGLSFAIFIVIASRLFKNWLFEGASFPKGVKLNSA
jgi:MFS family permease